MREREREREREGVEAFPDSAITLAHSAPPPDKFQSTLSSWVKNINKLDDLINRLRQLASSAPTDHRPQLSRKVVALRAMFKKQQERCIEFMALSKDYADDYLRDIETDIRQQSALLDSMEERLKAAKKLHGDAEDLQMLYESGTVASMNDLRATGKAVPVVSTQITNSFDLQVFRGRFQRTMPCLRRPTS